MTTENNPHNDDAQELDDSFIPIDEHEEFVSQDGKKISRKGIYLLPNLLTLGALFAGFYAIIAGMNGNFNAAGWAILIAAVLDGLDGRVARMTNTQSAFGAQFDSLADMVSFGVAPALVMFSWALGDLGKFGWSAAFIYVACAALRLARFNTQAGIADKAYFQGLASPAAAGTLVFTIWFFVDNGVAGETVRWLIFLETIVLGILMFSRVRYFSFKATPRGDKVPALWIFLAVLIIVLLALDPPVMGMILGSGYVISGLLVTIAGRRNWKLKREKRQEGVVRTDPLMDAEVSEADETDDTSHEAEEQKRD
jgi:CDP-diacylglycerol--serine O-phosphatidyltransferase